MAASPTPPPTLRPAVVSTEDLWAGGGPAVARPARGLLWSLSLALCQPLTSPLGPTGPLGPCKRESCVSVTHGLGGWALRAQRQPCGLVTSVSVRHCGVTATKCYSLSSSWAVFSVTETVPSTAVSELIFPKGVSAAWDLLCTCEFIPTVVTVTHDIEGSVPQAPFCSCVLGQQTAQDRRTHPCGRLGDSLDTMLCSGQAAKCPSSPGETPGGGLLSSQQAPPQ